MSHGRTPIRGRSNHVRMRGVTTHSLASSAVLMQFGDAGQSPAEA